jgi:bacterioferritin-associated ferredoxin
MYVCICRAVTDTQIRNCVNEGACTMRDLRNCLGVATQCGRCAITARDVLNEALEEVAQDIAGAA